MLAHSTLSRMATVSMTLLGVLAILGLVLPVTHSHPQCLDFYPPFIPSRPLVFCHDYTSWSCCTQDRDQELQDKVGMHIASVDEAPSATLCRQFHANVTCTECHSYAVHIYDGTPQGTGFPSLCPDYCSLYYAACRDALVVHSTMQSQQILRDAYTSSEWCALHTGGDPGYCFPTLSAVPGQQEPAAIQPVVAANADYICLQTIVSGLDLPVAAVNDGQSTSFVPASPLSGPHPHLPRRLCALLP